ncbi:hypothetical protein FPCIR_11423 [Fusarium pseudocircinatum]|uniref:F-box domain-containing protein n=1 Tax=Fusarium pseudocircinatum TaxID=56676 RepID=A0A8H5KUA0_9HYPO|nr:hypothetical protein FPCIR_11423 [Fusarium pseudocircinatum]
MSTPSLSTLPEELQVQILGYIYKYSLIDLRLVSRTFSRLITPIIFRAIRIRAYRDEPQRFLNIAMTPHLRYHVREVTCDTWTGSFPTEKRLELVDKFFEAIPSICVFPKLDTLNIRLERDEFHMYHNTQFRLLEMLFRCMEGAWNVHNYIGRDTTSPKVSGQRARTRVSRPLKTLSISNLVDYNSIKAMLSFQSVMNSGALKDLRISAADLNTQKCCLGVHHDLLDTVLSPGIASNLKVLSLFSWASWGWFPNMDFRLVGANDLPNLKVLALGQFEFSQWWQVEWIGSLGIEKLYLDECTVLYSDRNRATISQEETERAKNSAWREGSTYHTHTRWHHIFEHWANTMPNLRVFKIGQGWDLDDSCSWKAIDPTYEGDFYEHVEEEYEAVFQPFRDTYHQHFECPIPHTTGTGIRRYGPEAAQANAAVFLYVEQIKGFRGFGHTYTDSPGHGKDFMNVSSEEKERDRKAFDKFLTVVETRRKGLVGKE